MIKSVIRVAIAETSLIVRNGMVSSLKQIPDLNIHPIEVVSVDSLNDSIRIHCPDILIINPFFGGYLPVAHLRNERNASSLKVLALITSAVDEKLLKDFDDSILLYDDIEKITHKIKMLLTSSDNGDDNDEEEESKEPLTSREKEIVICVVKGLTNKEIAEKLYLSTHTVITHRRNIARKLQIHSSAGLTIYAIANKLIELKDIK